MPWFIDDVVAAGTLAGSPQPTIPAAGGLALRPWQDDDAPVVLRAFQDPAVQRWHCRSADSWEEALGWIGEWRDAWRGERMASWAVIGTDTGEVLGRVALREIVLADGSAELGYWMLPDTRGRGIAPRSVTALTRWAFDEVGLHRLELLHALGNDASCRVAAKAGFALEGTKRSALLHGDGWHDMHLHARVADDPDPGTD
ncbi:GNAT family N-acetyltransferase [Streptomyces sp. NPDC127068]|uniref:GNAT family N-acetyltransferase n=1 Tax=Streptomyces sp. NPDC127068 TaxID=3347127 RepID=UPI00365EB0CB